MQYVFIANDSRIISYWALINDTFKAEIGLSATRRH